MAKLVSLLLLALFAISMVGRVVMANEAQYHPQVSGILSQGNYGEGSVKPWQCSARCDTRCKQTQYKNACLLFCNKCCRKCQCVPPGYYGNKQVCACYNNWKTKEGGPKCP